MEKTIKIGDKEVRLNNNVGWAMTYRDQFGHDILQTLTPMFASALDVVGGIISQTGKTKDFGIEDLLAAMRVARRCGISVSTAQAALGINIKPNAEGVEASADAR